MAIVTVNVDASSVLLRLKNGGRRLAYAVSNAINATAKDVQTAERLRVASRFTLRDKRDFVLRQAAIIKPFASPTQLRFEAKVSVGQKPRLLLPGFETGAVREPFKGSSVAVPVIGGARPAKSQAVPESLYFQRLAFHRIGRGRRARGAARVLEGALRTYLIPGVGVFQRVGRGATRILYAFVRPFRLPHTLGFIETGTRIAKQVFPRYLAEEIQDALSYRGRR